MRRASDHALVAFAVFAAGCGYVHFDRIAEDRDASAPDGHAPVADPVVAAVVGDYDAREVAVAYDGVRDVVFVALRDRLYRVEAESLTAVGDTFDAGDDQPTHMAIDERRGSLYFVANVGDSTRKLFRIATDADAPMLRASDALTDTRSGGDDDPQSLLVDEEHDALYFVANVEADGRALFRARSGTSASARLTAADRLSNANPNGVDQVPQVALDRSRGLLYFSTNQAEAQFRLYRIGPDSTTAVVASDRISTVRRDFPNDYPVFLALDEARDRLVFRAIVANNPWPNAVFAASSATDRGSPVLLADALSSASELPMCNTAAFSSELDRLWLHCRSGDVERLHVLSSTDSPSRPLTATGALSEFGWPSDPARVATLVVPPERALFTVLDRAGDHTLFRSDADATQAVQVADLCVGCDDAPAELQFEASSRRLYLTAATADGDRRLVRLRVDATGVAGLDPDRVFPRVGSGADDDPRGLLLDPARGPLYFSANRDASTRKLFRANPDGTITPLAETNPGGDDDPLPLFVRPTTGALLVRARDPNGRLRLYWVR